MKFLVLIPFILIILTVVGCNQQEPKQEVQKQEIFDDTQKEAVVAEVKDQFMAFVNVLNEKDASKWSNFYSDDNFISAIAGVAFFQTKQAWVGAITNYFSDRKSQKVTVVNLNINALSPDKAILTCEDNTEFILENDTKVNSKHFFTLLWHKEESGWRIILSHESWADAIAE